MVSSCPRCQRANPGEALFCYFDGMLLPGRESRGPLQAGSAPFPTPFVFPGGLSCGNFNQLAMGCQKNWKLASDYLRDGHWARFMQGIGRLDLASAAQLAQADADPDQALDRFLSKIPSEAIPAPQLAVEPTLLNLGQLKPGADHKLSIAIANHGMRLLRGSVRVDVDWLTLGEGAGTPELFFQTPVETTIVVRVVGKHFRAEAKAKRATLNILTNGGEEAVAVTAEAPIVPFPEGILAGATTPREIAVRSKKQPKLAASLFESGAVEAWYRANGWDYPVQGPAGFGLGAIQQFFEALGLVKAPVVAIDQKTIHLSAPAGERCEFDLTVRSAEQKPVFAHAHGNQSWLIAKPPVFAGNRVTMPIEIPVVPDEAGKTLEATLTVRANGNQRFTVPVRLDVKPGTGRKSPRKESTPVATDAESAVGSAEFGMGRLVYWSGLLGGWSAFVGWLIAEAGLGRWLSSSDWIVMLMVVIVSAAIGGGLSIASALATRQWHGQRRKALIGLGGGAVAGLVGSFLGNTLYHVFGESSATLGVVARALGWAIMGLAIGAWDGLFTRDRVKLRNGLIGGGLGGLIGGVLFDPLTWLVGSPLSSRALGFVALGLFVGLLIGLVQVLLKDGWLTVVEGFRPGRQLILSQQETTLGTSEKSSLIFIAVGAKGVEPIHAAIERTPAGEFVLTDRQSRTGTMVNGTAIREPRRLRDGDVIEFGVNKVRFNERVRTHAAADAPA